MSGAPAGPTRPVVTTSWDDGHRLDPHLALLLEKYGIAGTFYIAPRNVEFDPADRLPANGIRDLSARFEIGAHTLSHQRLPFLGTDAAREEIRAGKAELEDIVGQSVVSFCYPRGEYTRDHVRLIGAAGFAFARTVRRSTLEVGPPLEARTTVNAYPHRVDGPLALRMAGLRPWTAAKLYLAWDELAVAWFDMCLRDGGVFHLWGHSWEVEARGDWKRLERVLDHIAARPDVTYVANRDVLTRGA